ncbi:MULTISPECIES: SAF domain-containing protein [Brevibacillus]|uniref:Flagellar biosynthesis protein FlgA n=1 Tax=Brevibacillus invocatus TaxID=173959 RepID=A0A3M8BZL9_9BACL|nr:MULTISPECIES: SAF domain-containing protein [Brevibacillus]MCM3081765.1 SAF domain-containing protein [Brevibacillus invocatus]MCM3432172.1 SAF domain-containing protein [Brevibacillus invocatus]MDH4619804.1 SAF domain-containing protein [Brevibacillus sp. AY1]RNB68799.1 flagellar biosynthesis protein FlgA [Brevibacillus invocatus]
MKKQTLFIICLISFLLAGSSFYAATQYIDALAAKKLFSPVVKVALGKEILPYEPITREDVVLVQEAVDAILPDSVREIENVLGKRSTQTIYGGEQLLSTKLTDNQLLPETGEARYEFPLMFIQPLTELRKGDHVKIWVRYKTMNELEDFPSPHHFQKTNDTADLLFESQLASVRDSNGIEIYTLKPNLLPSPDQMDAIFHGGTREKPMLNAEKRYRDYRVQPTALPAFVGFNLTDQQYKKVTEAMTYGMLQVGHIMVSEESTS